MTGKDLIAALGIDRATLRAWVDRGLPFARVNRRPDFDAAAVRQWLIAQGLAAETQHAKTRDEVAAYFGVGVRTVAAWLAAGCPGSAGAYDLHAIHAWRDSQRQARADQAADPLLAGAASPALEQYRRERAKIARLDRLERERELVPRDEVHTLLGQIAVVLRSAGETLQRTYGPEAQTILDEALDEAERLIDTLTAAERDDQRTALHVDAGP